MSRAVNREEGIRCGLAFQHELLAAAQITNGSVKFDETVYRGEQPCFGPLMEAKVYPRDHRISGEALDVDVLLAKAPAIVPEVTAIDRAGRIIDTDHRVQYLIDSDYVLKVKHPAGKLAIRCPNDAAHSGETSPTATVVLLPHFNGVAEAAIKCLHQSCSDLTQADFWKLAGYINVAMCDQASIAAPDPLDPAAFHGLAGDIVKTIEPNTEADSAALLLQILVAFGALVGRGPHVRVEGDQHHANLFAVLVGDTAKARKGTSWGRVREVFGVESWPAVISGLSSGEGLKWAVRDPIVKLEKNKKTGFKEEVEVDAGVLDKRLLVIEPEFAQVLRQSSRAGNTLSSTIRCAWDTGSLRTLTRSDPVTATGAHICIIAHVTADELRAELSATDSANGFANRFLFMSVARSKALPFGGIALDDEVLAALRSRITLMATQARMRDAVGMTASAREVWASVYPTLSEGLPGLFGAVTARAEAQAIRLGLVYALLDGASMIDTCHIRAALAVWERARDSARHIFGSALGDPVADEIVRSLRVAGAAGRTRTEIRDLFKRHESHERIGVALDLIARRKLARMEKRATGGAPVEVWTICI